MKREGRKDGGGNRRWERLWRELEGVWQDPLQLGLSSVVSHVENSL